MLNNNTIPQSTTTPHYQAIFDNAEVGIAQIDTTGRFLAVNPTFCDLLGYSKEELLKRTFKDITHPEDLDVNLIHLHQLLNGELKTYFTDKRYIHKNGDIVWARITISLVRSANGEPEYFIGIVQENRHYQLLESALKTQEQRAHAVLEACIDGFWVVETKSGKLLEVNDIYCQFSGYSRTELLTMRVSDLDCKESLEDINNHMRQVIDKGGDIFITRHKRKNGDIWPVEITVTYSNLYGGCAFVFTRDITERYINRALLELRVKLSDLVHHGSSNTLSQIAVDCAEALTNSKIGFFHLINADQQTISLQAWSTNTIEIFCSAHDIEQHYPIAKAGIWVDCVHQRRPVIHNDYEALSHKNGLPEGHPNIIRELIVPIFRDSNIIAILGVGNKSTDYTESDVKIVQEIGGLTIDYLERKQADERIEFMAYYDSLTNLPNRVLLLDRIHQAISQTDRSGKLLALAYLDLDGFKPINDRYGHAVGDLFLKVFAQRITQMLRAGDTLARLGGDEFALVIPGLAHMHDGEALLWRLLDTLAEPFHISSYEMHVGASIGFTLYPIDKTDPETLLRHADQAMYQAKWHGKNTVRLYDMAQNERIRLQQETIEEIRLALQNGELVLYYQPIIQLANREIAGFEANIRWHHPKRGLLQPDEFFPILDDTPKMLRLHKWALYQSLTQIADWDANDTKLLITVSINYHSLCEAEFLTFLVDQSIYWTREIMHQLSIEILKPINMTDLDSLIPIMQECTKLGIRLVLDCFYLNQLPLDQLKKLSIYRIKIGAQIVHAATKNLEGYNRLLTVIHQAQKLQLQIIIQGIDSLELAALFIDLNCQFGQGISLAQPIAIELISEWSRAWPLDPRCRNLQQLIPKQLHTALLQWAINNVQSWSKCVNYFIRNSGKAECPTLCTDQCPIYEWYNGLGKFRYGDRPGFAFQAARHRYLHLVAANLIKLLEHGFYDRAQAGLVNFNTQSDELIEMLERLDNEI